MLVLRARCLVMKDNAHIAQDRRALVEEHGNVQQYVDEVNGTLKSLNVIFKTMQVSLHSEVVGDAVCAGAQRHWRVDR